MALVYLFSILSILNVVAAVLRDKNTTALSAFNLFVVWSLPFAKGFSELFDIAFSLTWLQAFTPLIIGFVAAFVFILIWKPQSQMQK